MKTVKQIFSEGVVVMSDYKLDKQGHKYKAHRHTMGRKNLVTAKQIAAAMRKGPSSEMTEHINPYTSSLAEEDMANKEQKKKKQEPQKNEIPQKNAAPVPEKEKDVGQKMGGFLQRAIEKITGQKMFPVDEEAEQVDEISKKTLGSYISKAARDVGYEANLVGFKAGQKTKGYNPTEESPRELKRHAGIKRAVSKLTKEDVEDVEEARFSGKQMNKDFVYSRQHNPEDENVPYVEPKNEYYKKKMERLRAGLADIKKTVYPNVKEETEQIAEISKGLAAKYVQKKTAKIAKSDSLHTDKDVKNLSRAYKRMGVSEENEELQEAAVVKVATNPDGSKTVTVKTDTGKLVNHTYRQSSSINKLLKRRYGISGSL